MKIVSFSPIIPYPLDQGGAISQFAVLDKMRFNHQITLVLFPRSEAEIINIGKLQQCWPEVKIVFVNPEGTVAVAPPAEGKIIRLARQIVNRLRKSSSNDAQQKSPEYDELQNTYITNIIHKKSKAVINQLIQLIDFNSFDLVQVDFIELSDVLLLFPPGQKTVLVHHELRYKRLASRFGNPGPSFGTFERYVLDQVRLEEKKILEQYDGIVTFSDTDKDYIQNLVSDKQIGVSPFPVLDSSIKKESAKLKGKQLTKLSFVGGDGHFPNVHAIQWFADNILPALYSTFNLKLRVIGSWAQPNIDKFSDQAEMISFSGFVDNMEAELADSIMVSPIFIGSGIRTKILYAMGQQVPVISTTLGCEGINVLHKQSIMIANNLPEFVSAVRLLKEDDALLNRIVENALTIILENYTQDQVAASRTKFFNSLT